MGLLGPSKDQTLTEWVSEVQSPSPYGTAADPTQVQKSNIQVRVKNSANISISDDTLTTLTWDGEDFDTAGQDGAGMHYTSAAAMTGTVAKTNGSDLLTGTSTLFTSELGVGQVISVPGTSTELRMVAEIRSDTTLRVGHAFTATATGQTATRKNEYIAFVVAGRYLVTAWVNFAPDADGYRYVSIQHFNGTGTEDVARESRMAVSTANIDTNTWVSVPYNFNAGEFVSIAVRHTAGGAINVQVNTAGRGCGFAATRIF